MAREAKRDQRKPSAAVRLEREARARGDETDPCRLDRLLGYTFTEAAARVLAPARSNVSAVREALDEITDPAEAWEVLAARELIPLEWPSSGAREVVVRGVACDECDDRAPYIGHASDCPRRDIPATVRAAGTLATDATGVLTAEALARTSFSRIYDEETAIPRVVWRVGVVGSESAPMTSDRPAKNLRKSRKPGVSSAAYKLSQSARDRTDFETPRGYVRTSARTIARAPDARTGDRGPDRVGWALVADAWLRALATDVSCHWDWALSVREQRPNPYTPLCEIWMLGYAVEALDDEAIVLFAPSMTVRDEG